MGVPLDPSLPVDPNATGVAGYSFRDPKNVAFWWEKGAQTAWQTVPLTLDTLDQYGLWESDFFKPFKPIADLTGGDRDVAQSLAQQLDPMLGFALLTAVDTYTYRSDAVMLSTAQSYRPGKASEQHHISQATLDENAIVFTTHPKNEPQSGTQWPDDDGYWTGNGSLPRAAQHGALSMSLYTPVFANPGPPLDSFDYLPYTHAYFPQERFDEVVQAGGWTFGRKGSGYVALYSWRPVHWRTYSDPGDLHARAARVVRPRRRRRARQRVADAGRRRRAVPRLRRVPRRGARPRPCRSTPRPANGACRAASTSRTVADRGRGRIRHDGAAHGSRARASRSITASATTIRGRSRTSVRRPSRSPIPTAR